MEDYTIAGIITPPREGGVGILRLSGRKALAIAGQLFHPYGAAPLAPRVARLGRLSFQGEALDEALVLYFQAPASYTGEDVVEIQCHGSPFILREALKACLSLGARQSEAGEFTRRAFLNGRLDLTQSEAVLDTIRARSRGALAISLNQLQGGLKRRIASLREEILSLSAYLAASIDFPDDEIQEAYSKEKLEGSGEKILQELQRLLSTYREGKILKEGILTVLAGRPNAGKSSLLNCLLQEDRAIITDIPGTTRDALEEEVLLGDLLLRLVDTAGLRETEDPIEELGIRKAQDYLQRAQLVLYLADGTKGLEEEDEAHLSALREMEKEYLLVYTKGDLLDKPFPSGPRSLTVSARDGSGIEELKERIQGLFLGRDTETEAIASLRYYEALSQGAEALRSFLQGLEGGLPYDLLSIDLREAWGTLARITGEDYTEDLLEAIFSQFCIGK